MKDLQQQKQSQGLPMLILHSLSKMLEKLKAATEKYTPSKSLNRNIECCSSRSICDSHVHLQSSVTFHFSTRKLTTGLTHMSLLKVKLDCIYKGFGACLELTIYLL